VQQKLQAPDCRWDLIVCDEAHKLSATFFGGEIKYTKRYRLGQLLSSLTRHFLLMTATPHNGKEEDFQLFMALLDGDRSEGRFVDGVHTADVSDLMRRIVKENLLKFDATPLFPERAAPALARRTTAATPLAAAPRSVARHWPLLPRARPGSQNCGRMTTQRVRNRGYGRVECEGWRHHSSWLNGEAAPVFSQARTGGRCTIA
jgi:hypothetical protein